MEAITHYKAIDGRMFDDRAKCIEHEQEFVKDTVAKLNVVKSFCEENYCDKCPFMTKASNSPENCLFRLSMTYTDNDGTLTFDYPDGWDFNW